MTDGLNDHERECIRSALRAFPDVHRAILFGSRAIGSYGKVSDIDLALEGNHLTLEDLIKIKATISNTNLPYDVDLVVRSRITSPDLESHIKDYGVEWYRKDSS